mmetsp:Transcript_23093/g.41728  ORF Transcript_23093/g.41728 Transcript_23093/m.41728 type:complete len:109 (-) Transcript_23093:147-473(-)
MLALDDAIEPLTRAWCCYELFLASSKRMQIDIRAPTQSLLLYKQIENRATGLDIRSCRASNLNDYRMIMAAIAGMEDMINTKIIKLLGDRIHDLVQIFAATGHAETLV